MTLKKNVYTATGMTICQDWEFIFDMAEMTIYLRLNGVDHTVNRIISTRLKKLRSSDDNHVWGLYVHENFHWSQLYKADHTLGKILIDQSLILSIRWSCLNSSNKFDGNHFTYSNKMNDASKLLHLASINCAQFKCKIFMDQTLIPPLIYNWSTVEGVRNKKKSHSVVWLYLLVESVFFCGHNK